jgi:S1-C subfamily serine protease
VQPSVVQVQSQGSQGQAIGSGEIVSGDGYIVTNDHVVAGFSQYSVLLSNGKTYPATLVGEAPQDDLAVLKVSAGSALQPIAFGDSNKTQVGQFAVALGSPLGLQQSATFGIVSALNRTASEGPDGPAQELTGLIQTSAPINPGNSGGALVNLSGQLIGLPTLGAVDPNSGSAANGIGFAIPSDRVKFVMDQLIKNGHLVNSGQGFMGIQGEDVTPQLAATYHLGAQSGVLVVGFANSANGSSPAQQAGLQAQDIITAVDGQTVNDNNDLASALLSKQPGTQVKITYVRGTSTHTTTVTLGERPTNAG